VVGLAELRDSAVMLELACSLLEPEHHVAPDLVDEVRAEPAGATATYVLLLGRAYVLISGKVSAYGVGAE